MSEETCGDNECYTCFEAIETLQEPMSAEQLALKGMHSLKSPRVAEDSEYANWFDWYDVLNMTTQAIQTATEAKDAQIEELLRQVAELKREELNFPEKLCKCGCGALDGECANGYREQIEELEVKLAMMREPLILIELMRGLQAGV